MAIEEELKVIEHSKALASSRIAELWENPNHPLFLHHSDQPGAVLVSQPLVEDNYSTWNQSMSMALTIKNKKGFIDGSIKRSLTRIEDQQQWDRCDTLVKTWLLGSMSKDISGSVIHCRNARDMWAELKERFAHTNTVQLFNVENAIHGCEQGTGSVTTFFTKLKSLWDERDAICDVPPCCCDAAKEIKTYMEDQKTMKFLMGLNDNYATLRSNTVAIDPLPSVNKAYAMALRHEKQAEASNGKTLTQPEAAAFAVRKGERDFDAGRFEMRCEKCNMTNHRTKNCRAHLKCSHCGGKGHTYDYCRRRKAALARDQGSSKGNHVASMDDKSLNGVNFPFSQETCKQFIDLLSKNTVATANQVGNIPNYEELSGPKHIQATSDIDRWILHLSRSSIKELIIDIWEGSIYNIPSCLFSCQDIIHLELSNCLLKLPPAFQGFRSLKSIDIQDVMLAQNAFEDLIVCSPLLESLTLKRWDGFTHLKINAPNLQFLDIEGVFENVSLENTLNLADVTICLDGRVDETKIPGCSSNLLRLFVHLPQLRSLIIENYFLQYLSVGALPRKLPKPCQYLNYLFIKICFSVPEEILTALCLLRSSSALQELELEANYDGQVEVGKVNSWLDDNMSCQFPQLQLVKITGVCAVKAELDFIGFLLSSSPVLESMTVEPTTAKDSTELLKKLVRFKRSSVDAEIIYLDRSMHDSLILL